MRQQFIPREYQLPVMQHIQRLARCAVWADMGLGKTVATLTALLDLAMVEDDVFPALVVAPLRVATTTWPGEAAKWAHLEALRIQPITGEPAQRLAALQADAQVFTTNFEQLPWLIETLGEKWPFRTVVVDEATKLKGLRIDQRTSSTGKAFLHSNGGTQRALALARIAHHRVRRFVELTGTPAPNGLQDLWGQLWYVDAGERLGKSYTAFKDRWFRKADNGFGVKPMPQAQAEIQGKLADVCLTIKAADWFDLQAPIVNNIYVDLPPLGRKLYRAMEKEMFAELADGRTTEAVNAAAKTNKCLQMASGAVYLDPLAVDDRDSRAKEWHEVHDLKIQALREIVEEANGMPVLVAYHFRSDLARLSRAFPQGRHLDKDPATIIDWNAGRISVMFAHPQSAGHGLNLQDGGNILAFFSHWWNLEERLQILERIGPVRQAQSGYKRPVFIHNIIARSTVDEDVIERVESKREVQDILMDAMKRRSGV